MGKYSSDEEDHSDDEREKTRVYIGHINSETTRSDLERIFKKYGQLFEVWLARYPPLFAFVVFKNRHDAEEAVREMNGKLINGSRVEVNVARPRNRGRAGFGRSSMHDPDIRCYHCQERGHIARNCTRFTSGYRRYFSRSRSRSPGRGGHRSNSRDKRRSRSRSPVRRRQQSGGGREKTRKRSVSRSHSRSRSRERRRSRTEQGAQ